MMKPFRLAGLLMTSALLCFSITQLPVLGRSAGPGATSGVKEYEEFHELLHPLEHEALPKKDFARIRTNAKELVKRGEAIVKLGVPVGTDKKNVTEFRKELKKFSGALKKFSRDARTGSDKKLEESFSAVHDSYEMLMGMAPR
jgi:hypothetical protein